MSLLKISELSTLTGFNRETVSKRLTLAGVPDISGEKASRLYESKVALPALYDVSQHGGQADLMKERALLAKSQRTKIDLEIDLLQKRIIPAEVVERVWAGMTGAARSRLIGLPYRLATAAIAAGSFDEIQQAAIDLINEVLNELNAFDPDDYQQQRSASSTAKRVDVETSSSPDSDTVGGQTPPPKQRGKRGTRAMAN